MIAFVIGSLLVIWPWKVPAQVILGRDGEQKVVAYKWLSPDFSQMETIYAVLMIILGFMLVVGIEKLGAKFSNKANPS